MFNCVWRWCENGWWLIWFGIIALRLVVISDIVHSLVRSRVMAYGLGVGMFVKVGRDLWLSVYVASCLVNGF